MVSQGEIYWVSARDLDVQGGEQQKSRPYVIVSRTRINQMGRTVVGVPFTTKLNKACAHRILIPVEYMVKDISSHRELSTSVALTDHIRVLDSARLELPRMGYISQNVVGGLELALAYLFDI